MLSIAATINGNPVRVLELKSDADIAELMIETRTRVVDFIATAVLKFGFEDIEYLKKITPNDFTSSTCRMILERSRMNGTNPLFDIEENLMNRQAALSRQLYASLKVDKGLLINETGGFNSAYELLEGKEYGPSSLFFEGQRLTYTVNKPTTFINLENDPFLERYVVEKLGKLDPNFSFVTNLGRFGVDDLTHVFTEFKSNGGTTVFMYTTGTNVQQMYDYVKAAKRAGITTFYFKFNAGINDAIVQFLSDIEADGIRCVEIQDVTRPLGIDPALFSL